MKQIFFSVFYNQDLLEYQKMYVADQEQTLCMKITIKLAEHPILSLIACIVEQAFSQ